MRSARLFAALAVALCCSIAPAVAADKPNVLFVAVDDLNDWIGVLGGHPQAKTPNIDRLAARGVLFTNAHCAAPVCNPSRAALMTGLRPSTTGVYNNSNPWREILPEAVTLPQHLMQHGYLSMGAGKIYHGSFPDHASWNDYQKPGSSPKPSAEVAKDPHSKAGGLIWGRLDADDSELADYRTVDYCIDKLSRKLDQPLFLACGLIRPHLPWQVPRKYYDMFPIDEIQLPEVLADDLADIPPSGIRMAKPEGDHATILSTNNWKYAVQGYLATIAFCDAQIGRLLDAFDKSPYANNTIIVFWTDHGWHLGEKQHWRKFALWNDATRTPMVIVAPGVTQPGKRCDRSVSLLDLYPTIVELCGIEPRKEVEGTSLVPLLKDPQAARSEPAIITHGFSNHAVQTDRYRYIRYANGEEELYDHSNDPNEWTNLANRDDYASIKAELAQFLPKVNTPEGVRQQDRKRATQAKDKAKEKASANKKAKRAAK